MFIIKKNINKVYQIFICIIILSLVSPSVISIKYSNKSYKIQPTIWIAFFHGLGGNLTSNIPLINEINQQFNNSGIVLKFLNPQLPNDVNLNSWSQNIAISLKDWIEQNLQYNPRIVIVGHSMGGKAALYAAAHDDQGIFNYVESIITINSPIKNLGRYKLFTYMWNGLVVSLIAKKYLHSFKTASIIDIRDKDSSIDAKKWVIDEKKDWMAFISGENYPSDPSYDLKTMLGEVDPFPREMDDGIVPIDAQYTENAIIEYYGSYDHQSMINNQIVVKNLASIIVKYCFGEFINVSKFYEKGENTHITILPKEWTDIVGDRINFNSINNSLLNNSLIRDHYEVKILDKSMIRRDRINIIHWENNNITNINLIISSETCCGFITYQ